MDWTPITEPELRDLIIKAEARMDPPSARLWQAIRLPPQKWDGGLYGEPGGGFWVVALTGAQAIWYNDIEEGFNRSSYQEFGTLDDYFCNQDELEYAVMRILALIETGADRSLHRGAAAQYGLWPVPPCTSEPHNES